MKISEDIASVLRELSPILAGFKLALIVISYFGLGSVAKWVISYWYPFTRYIWDLVCDSFSLPHLPIILKDSLTALVFFVPLGISALIEKSKYGKNESEQSHRVLGGFFGILFLYLICRDVLTAIATSITHSERADSDLSIYVRDSLLALIQKVESAPLWMKILPLALYLSAAAFVAYRWRTTDPRKFKAVFIDQWQRVSRAATRIGFITSAVLAMLASALSVFDLFSGADISILTSLAIMLIIVTIIAAATTYAPRKLFLTTGASIAFILAALFFELAISAIRFIENTPV